ncbi:HK97-gp10 family putative phage morphogenesis protein [Novosphingobium olei]|uniref:HK97-gp10 family putative phage morphogenesis protein n=1 Tax=Novosphingobium olei TaxID=2728851 RepID=UPI003084AD2D|nr:HK97 gp10 family phage protein [Novosphingobium olei]
MTMKVRDKWDARLKALAGPEVIKAARRVLYVGSDMIRAEAFRSISEGSVSGKGHVPSKPGEPPNRDTGVLQAGIENRMVSDLEAEVSSNAPYAAPLEFGTSRMEARPYMRPARDKMAPEVQRLFASEIGKLAKRSA